MAIPFFSSISNVIETTDNEILFIAKKTPNVISRETPESDPEVSTLYNRRAREGETIVLAAEYDAKPNVTIQWKRNGDVMYQAFNLPSRGQTMMIINNVQAKHHKNIYSVEVFDSRYRITESSAKIKVRGYDHGSSSSSGE